MDDLKPHEKMFCVQLLEEVDKEAMESIRELVELEDRAQKLRADAIDYQRKRIGAIARILGISPSELCGTDAKADTETVH